MEKVDKVIAEYKSTKGRILRYNPEKYTYMFDDTGIDEEVQEILIKTILYNVITKRNKIDSVKSGVNL